MQIRLETKLEKNSFIFLSILEDSYFKSNLLNFLESSTRYPRRDLSISVVADSFARSRNYFERFPLSILSTATKKFTPVQYICIYISRSNNKEPRRCIALYLENTKEQQMLFAVATYHPPPCPLYPVVFIPVARNIILSRGNREAHLVKLRTAGSYTRCISRRIQLRLAQCRIPIENQRFDSVIVTKGRHSRPVRATILSDSGRSAPEARAR